MPRRKREAGERQLSTFGSRIRRRKRLRHVQDQQFAVGVGQALSPAKAENGTFFPPAVNT
jgi:hypothetical protein